MGDTAHRLVELLVAYGPWLIFLATFLETAAFVGLVVPAEATVLLAAVLAQRGILELSDVAAATFVGGFLGDQAGYLLGRVGGGRVARREGLLGRIWRRYELRAADLFRRHAALAVTLSRFVSFIRTLMPWFAGMSRLSYPRYVFFDVLGVVGWGAATIAAGYLAAESWQKVVLWFGPVTALLVVVLVILLFVLAHRRRAV